MSRRHDYMRTIDIYTCDNCGNQYRFSKLRPGFRAAGWLVVGESQDSDTYLPEGRHFCSVSCLRCFGDWEPRTNRLPPRNPVQEGGAE